MTQGKRISADIGDDALHAIRKLPAAARPGRSAAGEGQTAATTRLDVHIRSIGPIEAGEPVVAIGQLLGLPELRGIVAWQQQPVRR